MTETRITEISATSSQSFEAAINASLSRANAMLDDIEGAWMKDMRVVVRAGRVEEYRVSLKLAFVHR